MAGATGSGRRGRLLSGLPESAKTVGPETLSIHHCEVVIPDTVASSGLVRCHALLNSLRPRRMGLFGAVAALWLRSEAR